MKKTETKAKAQKQTDTKNKMLTLEEILNRVNTENKTDEFYNDIFARILKTRFDYDKQTTLTQVKNEKINIASVLVFSELRKVFNELVMNYENIDARSTDFKQAKIYVDKANNKKIQIYVKIANKDKKISDIFFSICTTCDSNYTEQLKALNYDIIEKTKSKKDRIKYNDLVSEIKTVYAVLQRKENK